jgi:hypothetical protein
MPGSSPAQHLKLGHYQEEQGVAFIRSELSFCALLVAVVYDRILALIKRRYKLCRPA